jgi:hypothetical protein
MFPPILSLGNHILHNACGSRETVLSRSLKMDLCQLTWERLIFLHLFKSGSLTSVKHCNDRLLSVDRHTSDRRCHNMLIRFNHVSPNVKKQKRRLCPERIANAFLVLYVVCYRFPSLRIYFGGSLTNTVSCFPENIALSRRRFPELHASVHPD